MSEGVDAGAILRLPARVEGGQLVKSMPGPAGQVEVVVIGRQWKQIE